MTDGPAHRYAVYFAPPADHALWQAGCDWLGRDARVGFPVGCPPPDRRSPWRYGLHATLKAPLQLRPGATEVRFLAAVADVAAAHRSFALPPLRVATLSDFVALRPVEEPPEDAPLRRLADDVVARVDPWRAPAGTDDRARRLAAVEPNDAARRAAIERWGYPHVFAHWRFHLTLSDSLASADERERVRVEAARHFDEALATPLCCDALSVFIERAPGEPFELAWRLPLGA